MLLPGCMSRDDPGPVEVTILSFRTLEDPLHAEWVIEFRNTGTLPVIDLDVHNVHPSIVDGGKYAIDGHNYKVLQRYPSKEEKFSGAEPLYPPAVSDANGTRPLIEVAELAPGERIAQRVVEVFKGDFQGEINATDFYALRVPVYYTYKNHDWHASHNLACFDREGNRIHIVGSPRGYCDRVSALNRDAPSWSRYKES